jgi:hypothetical protein
MATIVHATESIETKTIEGFVVVEHGRKEAQGKAEELVDFEGPEDKSNPINWSAAYKWTVVGAMSVMTMIA